MKPALRPAMYPETAHSKNLDRKSAKSTSTCPNIQLHVAIIEDIPAPYQSIGKHGDSCVGFANKVRNKLVTTLTGSGL